ncbi:Crp/Fnr family transcriptional regulator [Luteimonas sp. A478]
MTSSQPSPEAPSAEPVTVDRSSGCVHRKRMRGDCAGCVARELAACSVIPVEEAQTLEEMGGQIRLPAGGVLAREGDPRKEVHTVVSGMMRNTRLLPDGRRFVAAFLLPGDFIGFSNATHYRGTVEAVTESTLCAFSNAGVRSLCERYPEFEKNLFDRACGELDVTRSYQMTLARMTPVERLSVFLLDLSSRQYRRGGRENHVDLPMTRADIADHLGLTIETVSRSFSRLKQEGTLYFEHPHHIELRDPVRLREMAAR